MADSVKDSFSNLSLAVFSELVNRAALASQLGQQSYGGDRDIHESLGYLNNITFADYKARYLRQDIARAIIDRPVNATWDGDLLIEESKENDTPFEKAWIDLSKRLNLKSIFSRVDRASGIGRYGVLFLGFDDVSNVDEFQNEVTGKRNLIYLKPLTEGSAEIQTFDNDPKSERYGLPEFYNIQTGDANISSSVKVHYSRVIHIISGNIESEVYGTPRLEPVFNRLMDIEKIVGGSAEMFWRGARPGYQGVLDKDYQMTPTMRTELKDQVQQFENNLRRIFMNEGVKLEGLAPQVESPKDHLEVQIQMISSETGIPNRILSGSERGELSSSQDKNEWMFFIKNRRELFVEPAIIKPFVDVCIEHGVLPNPKQGYYTKWSDLFSLSEKEKAEVGQIRATALKEYAQTPAVEGIVSPELFIEHFLGLSDEIIAKVIEGMKNISFEPPVTKEEIDILEFSTNGKKK